jgi:SNF2 family DNA or RNA helicase
MHLNLHDFEKYINASILKRGQSYLRQGRIMTLEEEEGHPGSWLASVEGSYDDYEVHIFINEEEQITLCDCSCPYDWGEYCKHVVAVLLKIRTLQLSRGYKKKTVSRNVKKPSVEEMLEQFKELPLIEQRILKILALYWEPSSADNIATLYKECRFEKQSGKQSFNFIHAPLQLLFSQKILERTDYRHFQLPHEYADALCNEYYASDEDLKKIANHILRTRSYYSSWYDASFSERQFRNMRLGRYLDNLRLFEDAFNNLTASREKGYSYLELMEYWLGAGFQREKWDALGPGVRFFMLYKHIELAMITLTDISFTLIEYTEESIQGLNPGGRATLADLMAQWQLLRGDWKKIQEISKFFSEDTALSFAGISLLLEGNREEAEKAFRTARTKLRQSSKKQELDHINGVFFTLSQIQPHDLPANQKIKKQLDHLSKQSGLYTTAFYYLTGLLEFFENKKAYAEQVLSEEPQIPLHRFFLYLCRYWVDPNLIKPTIVEAYRNRLTSEGYHWMAAEMSALLKALGHPVDASQLPKGPPLIELLPRIEAWETALSILLNIGGKSGSQSQLENRIAWLIDFDNELIQARHQKLGKNGWTKGRPISFHRFHREKIPGLTPQDERFVKAKGYGEGSEIYLSRMHPSWKELVGHPLLFLKKSPKTAVQLVEVKPKLLAKRTDEGFQLSFVPEVSAEGSVVIKETPTRYLFVEISPQIAQIAEALNHHTLSIPQKGEAQLQKVLSGLAETIDIQSSFEDDRLPAVEADSRICIHLLPVGDGFHVEPYVKPFQSEPPYLKPAQGEAHLIGTVEGQRLSTTRDLQAEEENLQSLRKKVPVLKKKLSGHTWKLENAETCLQLLLQLKPLIEDKSIIVEWPQGEKLKLDSVVGMDQFRMSIRDGNNWFELDGELKVNEEKVLSLQELLLLSEQETSFVEISPGKFLALTEEFRKRLQSINGLPSQDKKNGKLLLHPLAAHGMEDFTEAVEHLDASPAFLENRQRLEAAFGKKFRVPKAFKAKLRPYQLEGYQWLCRCAAWGVGACLADDMGLGKTIQALAFLNRRFKMGPALVVAPASVCRNWVAETQRFAPQLSPVLFGEGDRKADMEAAGKGSVVIVTYDLMVRESELFLGKKWATVILDEAQAIKNQATRRSKTAMKLEADFRMVMTGTPIENHLGELWNLFQFINPGLLGKLDSFNQRFTLPIEKYKNKNRQEQLHRLVKPFILRRKKDEVLKDLPEKTEVTLSVELSDEERAFYEALRRNAIDNLTATEQEQAGQHHLRILAEIMKLRRAACHPVLADKTVKLKSSAKLELFNEIVQELLDNGHKALVFSQFVDHLKILEKQLKKQKIPYQYLDGSTPGKKRQAAIDAFQAGQGDIFLISLKAGGTGLNLTAADYVIHTDPWWNPAVEDQATDRAHRIGQNKPVTVYRLIAQQTIEEKILKLHAQKRELADSLLAGTHASAKLTSKDLMALLERE